MPAAAPQPHELHAPLIAMTVRRYGKHLPPDEAYNLALTGFYAGWNQWTPGAAKQITYAITAAKHKLIHSIRSHTNRRNTLNRTMASLDAPLTDDSASTLLDLIAQPAPHPADPLIHQEQLSALRAALLTLKPRPRKVLHLLYTEGLTFRAAGDRLDISPQAVYANQQKALATLRHRLSPDPVPSLSSRPKSPPHPDPCPSVSIRG
jgi:RNA polymerase sigma factor (sigma-70 family)